MNINLILFGLFLLYLVDFTITVLSVKWYKWKYPKEDYMESEANLFLRYLWRRLGLTKGSLVALIALTPIFLLVVYMSNLDDRLIFYMLGVYTLVYHNHFQNILFIYRHRKKKKRHYKRKEVTKDGRC